MKICGLQKTTLLDYPGKVACTVFLSGCNFRCPWCHNYDLATGEAPETMSIPDLLEFLQERKGKLEGVAITGGEPCMNRDLPDLLKEIKEMGYKVKLDTNGTYYSMLSRLIRDELVDYVAMDIKNRISKYDLTVGTTADLEQIGMSKKLLMAEFVPYEFRTTVVDEFHRPSDFEIIGRWIRGAKNYYLQSFTDRDSVPYNFHAPSPEKLQECLETVRKYVPNAFLRGV